MSTRKIRVLIVDDSSVIRTLLTGLLSSDPDIEVVGTACDPYVAREKLIALKPDVMTLDIEMPRMDGITFLEKVMEHLPVRTIVLSSLTTHSAPISLRALQAGAIEVLAKPALDVSQSLQTMAKEIIARVKMVASARLPENRQPFFNKPEAAKRIGASRTFLERTTHQVLAIASSTGGTEALKVLLSGMPEDIPGTLIVQHMPPLFTRTYAESLQRILPFEVKEAQDGDRVLPGRVLLAPGNWHMELNRNGAFYLVKLHQSPPLHGVRPAADYLMSSVARVAGQNSIGVVLTGMGKDGAQGLLAMRNSGGYNIAQDESSCVVFGMPKEAIAIGAIHAILPLPKISGEIVAQVRARNPHD